MGDPQFGLRKLPGESWREAALRVAKPWGLEAEVADQYDLEVSRGVEDARAAWNACFDWDVLEVRNAE